LGEVGGEGEYVSVGAGVGFDMWLFGGGGRGLIVGRDGGEGRSVLGLGLCRNAEGEAVGGVVGFCLRWTWLAKFILYLMGAKGVAGI
jgi:hypothetical protein